MHLSANDSTITRFMRALRFQQGGMPTPNHIYDE